MKINQLILFFCLVLFSGEIFSQEKIEKNYYHYKGTIDDNQSLSMDLFFQDSKIRGWCFIGENSQRIRLIGSQTEDELFQVFEINPEKQKEFSNKLISFNGFFDENKSIFGYCLNVDNQAKSVFKISLDYSESAVFDFYKYKSKIISSDNLFPMIDIEMEMAYPKYHSEVINDKFLSSILDVEYCTDIDSCIYEIIHRFVEENAIEPKRKKNNDENWIFYSKTDVFYNDNNFVTLLKSSYIFIGEESGSTDLKYLVYNNKTGELWQMTDIIDSNKNDILIEKIKLELEKQGFDISLVSMQNTTSVGIDNYGLHFVYNFFDDGPMVVNVIDVSLSYENAKDVLTDEFKSSFNNKFKTSGK